MKQYKYDLHFHTAEVSLCGNVDAKDGIKAYADAGFSGVVVTDHYYKEYFERLGNLSWDKKIDRYLEGFHNAVEAGEKYGVNVFLGIELRFPENWNDYLVFGLTEEYLRNNPKLYQYGIEGIKKHLAKTNCDALVFQAHPYRVGMQRVKPQYLDGVETLNGHARHESNNHLAKQFAEKHNLLECSGSDYHDKGAHATAGIVVDKPIENSQQLVQVLRARTFEFYVKGK